MTRYTLEQKHAAVVRALALVAMLLAVAGNSLAQDGDGAGEAVPIRIDIARTRHTMAGGIGASWHAIGPTPYWYGDLDGRENRICRGSGFGGYPPLGFTKAWDDLRAHARWLGLSFCRVEVDVRMYEPDRRRFDWDNDEMKALDRILDICRANHADVFLTQMWQDVAWNAHAGVSRLQSAPRSVDDFAHGLGTLLERLVKTKGYTCIRWVAVNNEPGFDGCWWLGPDKKAAGIMPAVRALRAELDRRGLGKLSVAGPDSFNLAMAGFQAEDKAVGALALHCYEGEAPTELFRTATATAAARGIPVFVTEFGHFFAADCEGVSFAEGGPRSAAPKSYAAQLLNAEKVIRGLNAGIDGLNRWSFINRGDLDGQWQMVRTWNPVTWEYLKEVRPEPAPYYAYGILARFTARHSDVLDTQCDSRRVFAVALRSPKGDLTVLVLNKSERAEPMRLSLAGLQADRALWMYRVTEDAVSKPDYRMEPQRKFEIGPARREIADTLPAGSITAYSSRRLAHAEPGVAAE
jgi:hypothetical protein